MTTLHRRKNKTCQRESVSASCFYSDITSNKDTPNKCLYYTYLTSHSSYMTPMIATLGTKKEKPIGEIPQPYFTHQQPWKGKTKQQATSTLGNVPPSPSVSWKHCGTVHPVSASPLPTGSLLVGSCPSPPRLLFCFARRPVQTETERCFVVWCEKQNHSWF